MKLKELRLGNLVAKIPIVQGGMGVGVSGVNLSSAVANEGGVGVISGVMIGYKESDFKTNTLEANNRAIIKAIRNAKEKAKTGIQGINLMVASRNYLDLAKTCVKEKVDFIVSGAGLPIDLSKIVKGSKTMAIPIVSSGRAAKLILNVWKKHSDYIPPAIVVEGPEAGGHLGFKKEELIKGIAQKLEDIVSDVKKVAENFARENNTEISIIAGGGIYDEYDMKRVLDSGADAVQMATRFIATEECDADIEYKKKYIGVNKEDVVLVDSPAGLPGRAIKNKFVAKREICNEKVNSCIACLKTCDFRITPYCISKALINAVMGKTDEGLLFCGANVWKNEKITTVKEIFASLEKGYLKL